MTVSAPFAIRGRTLAFKADPFRVPVEDAVSANDDGAVVVRDGKIVEVGPAHEVLAHHPGVAVEAYGPDALIMAGFVDSHAHYPQLEIIGSYGEQLLEWLETYTFPTETKYADFQYARAGAETYLDLALSNGITSASVFSATYPASVDALFEGALARGMRIVTGKNLMDRNCPVALRDTAVGGYEQSEALIAKWHGKGRLTYAVTPRFAVTSTPEQLESAGALWRAHPTTLMQTHMSENHAEIRWVRELYPEAPDYLGAYEAFGLIGEGANFGHCIHLTEREIARLKETGSAISHCPTSNAFIGSGLFDMQGLRDCDDPIRVGLATDIGGGSSLSMFDTMKAAYEIAQLRGYSLHPIKAFWLATVGSAGALRMDGKVGNLAAGYEADIVVLDLHSTPIVRRRMREADSLSEALFIQMILADDRAVRATYVAGRKLHDRDQTHVDR
ncbi:guanine deaminase [Methylopila sp. M107]|uniref:guanine deaminase n=1 Tax=Methylopila sp. M107 TaxID=1101190 RepID=UPI00036C4F76|nr:guanine deaminase [Methylopila sp. M107]